MTDLESFRLSEEDIKMGIEDCCTQLLIEARRQKKGARTLNDLSSKNPTIIYVTGQPGAGKTTLGKYKQTEYAKKGECVIDIGSDKIATFHKYYNELLRLLPNECYTISREFVKFAKPDILNRLMSNKISIVRECSLSKGEKDYTGMQRFKDNGYDIEINVMSVDKYDSFLSSIERDISLIEIGFDPRPVAKSNHDRMYEPLLHELFEIQKRKIASRINVYTKGKDSIKPQLVWSIGDTRYQNAQEAIVEERYKGRRELLQNPQAYLERLNNARNKIFMMIDEKRLRDNYINDINQLEREFLNELALDRNS